MSKSTIVTALSYLLLISSAAGFAATLAPGYVALMTLSSIGIIAGAIMADEEQRQAEADRHFTNRLNK